MEKPKPFDGNHQRILIDDPIYTVYDLAGIESDKLLRFFFAGGAVDAYCTKCERTSVFALENQNYYSLDSKAKTIPRQITWVVKAECSRRGTIYDQCEGKLVFCFFRNEDSLTKIGQYPSKAVLDFGILDPVFSQELDKDFRAELGRAVGLHAHGVGVGSFVYLRRIFEKLIEEAHQSARQDQGWDEDLFQKSRMEEKIKQLHSHLPNRLVTTAYLYGILSKGVHELTEQECLGHFDLLQRAIQMILKERHEDKEYRQIANSLRAEGEKLIKVAKS